MWPAPRSSLADTGSLVFGLVSFVDLIVNRSVDRIELNVLRHAGGGDPSGLLAHRCFVPARCRTVVRPNVHSVIDDNGPNPRWSAVRVSVIPKRRDVQVIGSG